MYSRMAYKAKSGLSFWSSYIYLPQVDIGSQVQPSNPLLQC